jgi:shikimate dehydrogenase
VTGEIRGSTRVVALLGHPVAHSLSPWMQNAAFAALALDWAYVALDVAPERLADAVRGLTALGFAGANVTAPHKLAVAELLASDTPTVNTLVVQGDELAPFTTDAAVLAEVEAERPVVLGDGGAAAAFRVALPHARVFSRRGDWPPDTREADLVVNATSARDEIVVEVGPGQTLVDLPYPSSATAEAARAAGARVLDGLDVLVAQGAASFALWTGLPAPLEVMRAAVRSPP